MGGFAPKLLCNFGEDDDRWDFGPVEGSIWRWVFDICGFMSDLTIDGVESSGNHPKEGEASSIVQFKQV